MTAVRLLPALLAASIVAAGAARGAEAGDVLGVAHAGGKYALTQGDYLNEGADQVLALGARTIKLWFVNPAREYRFHTDWPACTSLVQLAESPPYRAVFAKPFKTIILVAYAMGRDGTYWRKGVTAEQARDEERQFFGLARHLQTACRGSGKTFILQHWEGDWSIRTAADPKHAPAQQAIDGMVAWLNARQAGVSAARAADPGGDVRVYHAPEVNLVVSSMREGRPNVVNRVLPRTRPDLVSYSSWDALSDPALLRRALDYIAEQAPDSEAFGAKNVYVGEFGAPENAGPADRQQAKIRGAFETALAWGCPYAVFWQVYCNEPLREPVRKNEDCRGFWLVRPDGTRAWAWDYFRGAMGLAPAAR